MNRYNFGVIGNCSCLAYKNFNQWGNIPQTYSHVGLVNAVYRLSKKLDKQIFL